MANNERQPLGYTNSFISLLNALSSEINDPQTPVPQSTQQYDLPEETSNFLTNTVLSSGPSHFQDIQSPQLAQFPQQHEHEHEHEHHLPEDPRNALTYLASCSDPSHSQTIEPPAITQFVQSYHHLPKATRDALANTCGFHYPTSVASLSQIHDPDIFFSICFILVQQPDLHPFLSWVRIPRGEDQVDLEYSHDMNTISVSIQRKIGLTTSRIACRLKDQGHYVQPIIGDPWNHGQPPPPPADPHSLAYSPHTSPLFPHSLQCDIHWHSDPPQFQSGPSSTFPTLSRQSTLSGTNTLNSPLLFPSTPADVNQTPNSPQPLSPTPSPSLYSSFSSPTESSVSNNHFTLSRTPTLTTGGDTSGLFSNPHRSE